MLGEIDLWRRLGAVIAEEIESRSAAILSGNLDHMERYRFETGFLRGLVWVLDRAQELADGARKPEEEDAG